MTDKPSRLDIAAAVVVLRLFPIPENISDEAVTRVADWLAALPSVEALRAAREEVAYSAELRAEISAVNEDGLCQDQAEREVADLRAVVDWFPGVATKLGKRLC